MKMLGLIGGMSWESSAHYYRLINQGVRKACGATASARLLLWSFNFAEIEALQHSGQWLEQEALLVEAARRLEAAGAQVLLICSNTMHKLAQNVEQAVAIPLLHIADPSAQAAAATGIVKVGLLGTSFTMEQDFFKDRLQQHGLDVLVPGAADRALVHRIIYEELVVGEVRDASRLAYRGVIERLVEAGAEAIILGCTEIMLLIGPMDSPVPLFDTTQLHAQAAVAAALAD
jgi:aspartate racemase